MHWRLDELRARLLATLSRGSHDRDMDDELRFHLEMATERNIRRGMPPDDARRAALAAFGGVQRTREDAWDGQRLRWLEDIGQDARHAVRMLGRTPGFTLAAVLTLAIGIGATTAILGVVDAALLRPLPYAEPERLVAFMPNEYDAHLRWTERAGSLESSGAYTFGSSSVAGGAEPVRVWTLAVTSSLLPTLGVRPVIGRGFSAEDDLPNAPARVILRHGFWRAHFAADVRLLGATIEIDGTAHEVIGVLPPELEFPPRLRRGDGSLPPAPDLWLGVGGLGDLHERGGFFAIGRLAPGATVEHAAAELSAAATERLASAAAAGPPSGLDGRAPEPMRVQVDQIAEAVVAPIRPAIFAFTAGVALVLLIACANLGGLLLARIAGRRRELAIRVSLGASRGRVVRQVLTESAVLAAAGAVAGIGLAWLLLRTITALAPAELARVHDATLNARVLAMTLALTAVTALLIGVLPALRGARGGASSSLSASRGTTPDRGTGRAHATLVACEVAFAVVLLIGGGLLLRSFAALAAVDPGFRAEGLVTAELLVPGDRYPNRASVLGFFDEVEERLRALPGVRAVSAIDRLPYGQSSSRIPFDIVGHPPSGAERPTGLNTAARPGYFATMGIPVLEGRAITADDAAGAPRVVVIGRALADRFWPGASPVGERVLIFGSEREIVGVVGDVRHFGPAAPPDPMIYLPQAQDIATRRLMTVIVRTDAAPEELLAAVRGEIRALDPALPISNLRTFGALRSEKTAGERFNALLIASVATLALLLAAVGIYGVMSFVVAQRTREIGVRMALGATRGSVRATFVRQAMRAVAIGAVAGIIIAAAASRFLRGMLFGIGTTDPATYVGVAALIAVVALLAAWGPAARAARVSPREAMVGE